MRIAILGLTFPFRGGISHYTTLLTRALMKRHDARLFALRRQYPERWFPGKTQKDFSRIPFSVSHDPCLDSLNPLTWLITFKKIKRFGPDFILFSWWHPFFAPAFGTIGYLARWTAGIPVCYLCHNIYPHEPTRLDTVLLRYAFGSATGLITHSETGCRQLRQIVPKARIGKGPHPHYGVFAEAGLPSMPAAKARLGLSGKRVLLFFGVIREYKGLKYLLKAMYRLPPEEHYHLVVAGEFYDDIRIYRSDLKRLRCRRQLTLVDAYVPNEAVPTYFSAADLVVLPYVDVNQSGIIQLAYGFLKPVVATAVGGLPETVIDGVTGYLVPPKNPEAIAEAIRRYFERDDPKVFADRIRRERGKYAWEKMVAAIADLGTRSMEAAGPAGRF